MPDSLARTAWAALRALLPCALLALGIVAVPGAAQAQIGKLLSPGPLSRAHASLEGASNCEKCHEPGRKVTAERCLQCHRPIAQRIAARKGVHRNVQGDCTGCHVEHAGLNAELRPFDTARFDHTSDAGFPLDGRHARLGCTSCHKTRSFLTVQSACATCHTDVHKGALGADCAGCHPTSVAFRDTARAFDHGRTAFPLLGAHRTVACARCHVNQAYRGVKFEQCSDCHKTPHRQALADSCTACHTQENWKTQKIDHGRTAFPLRGRHAAVACVKCHVRPATQVSLKFERCADCHADPHKGVFKQDCGACHQETGFARTSFDHTKTAFPLTGRHTALGCEQCHKNAASLKMAPRPNQKPVIAAVDFRGLSSTCVSCHKDAHGGELGTNCESCHSTASFKVARFNHPRFPEFFAGRHADVACARCHGGTTDLAVASRQPASPGRYKNVSTACASCHQDVHLGQLGAACETCHSVAAARFAPDRFSHERAAYQLVGAHRNVECRACHKQETAVFPAGRGTAVRLKGMATTCASCHRDEHLGQVGTACETCHTVEDPKYTPSRFSHTRAKFQLTGRHATVPCASCHKRETATFPAGNGTAVRLTGLSSACQSCHRDTHLGQLGTQCERCHATTTFRLTGYTHTRFPELFAGAHLSKPCSACHKQQEAVYPAGAGTAVRYTGLGGACTSCHADAHEGGFGTNCQSCHQPTEWRAVSRGFHQATNFALEGRHLTVACAECHTKGVTKGTPTTCYDCHWVRRQDDRYRTRLGSQCEECHRPSSWTAVRWDHAAQTGFALSPVHRALGCDGCHKDQKFTGSGLTCVSCHLADYQRTTNPNHAAAGFPTTCDACHLASASNWNTSFNHATVFPLVGVHATQPCSACHKNSVFPGTPTDCYGCHRTDYNQTKNPNHTAAGFPTTCQSCHQASAASWTAAFNHNAVYPLLGIHAAQPCAACHKNNVYAGTTTVCSGCHLADYNASKNPNHVTAGFPTICDACHKASDASWQQGVFNHSNFYQLLGVHATQPCTACHKNNVYKGTPTDCYLCHQADYVNARNPNHIAAGFPTTCASCHRASDSTWQQGTFNHTWFPITSGRHAGIACATCHTDPNNYATFSCVNGCHPRSSTDSQHGGVSGYRYDSLACYACHPTGSGGRPAPLAAMVRLPRRGLASAPVLLASHRTTTSVAIRPMPAHVPAVMRARSTR